jgi:hypothetical protein
MPRTRKRIGVGAKVDCFARLLHPGKEIKTRFKNMKSSFRLKNLVVIGQAVEKVNKATIECVVVHSDEVKDANDEYVRLYAATKHYTVKEEGNVNELFYDAPPVVVEAEVLPDEEAYLLPSEVVEIIQRGNFDDHDMIVLQDSVQVDDDNAPAPENIPSANDND